MPTGATMQLVAYGAQDVYLSSNPQVTFFKQMYRRHTNFAMEAVEQPFNNAINFGKRVTATIARSGDLIGRTYLQVTLPQIDLTQISQTGTAANGGPTLNDISGTQFRWLNWIGHNLIRNYDVEIGGQRIDKHYGDWLHIWNELTLPAGKQLGYAEMVGNVPELVNVITSVGGDGACDSGCGTETGSPHMPWEQRSCCPEYTLYIPLQFWFNRHVGLALPLIALQYHEVRINVEVNDARNLLWTNTPVLLDYVNNIGITGSLFVDYFYLDSEERRRFAEVAHEYLIEQLQFTGDESVSSSANKIKMSFNHPVKEVVWVVQRDSFVTCDASVIDPWKGQQAFNYTDYWDRGILENGGYAVSLQQGMAGCNPTVIGKIQLNGQDRFTEREGRYFNNVQPYQHHTNIPAKGINVYSFALNPEQHQPSGTCNFSRIDTANLFLNLSANTIGNGNTAKVRIYAVNYNVLRVMAGMAGLAYAN